MLTCNVFCTDRREPPCTNAVLVKPADEDYFLPGQWAIHFSSLATLMAFAANNGPIIISVGRNQTDFFPQYDNEYPTIEIREMNRK